SRHVHSPDYVPRHRLRDPVFPLLPQPFHFVNVVTQDPVHEGFPDARSRCCREVPVEYVGDLPHPGGGRVRLDAYDLPLDPCRLWLPVAVEGFSLCGSPEYGRGLASGEADQGECHPGDEEKSQKKCCVRSGWHKNISRSRPERKNIISGPFCFLLRPLEFFQNFVESRRDFSAGIQNVFLPFSGQRTENVLCPAFFPRHVFYEFSKMADRLRVLLFFARIHPQWLDQQFVQDKSL
ncbi:MAG: hypothetical protein WCR04_10170, partial [Fibrobacteraceae bacterium]